MTFDEVTPVAKCVAVWRSVWAGADVDGSVRQMVQLLGPLKYNTMVHVAHFTYKNAPIK